MRRTVLGFATTMVAAMLAACGVAMLAVKDPAQAADPGQNGRIAYVSHLPSGLHEIYTMKPNGTDRKQLTDDSVYDTSPVYSPSGTKIAFVGQGPDGTDRQLVVQDGRDPVWSPDGRKIAFTRDSHVYTVNPDGTSEREVPGTPPENGPSESCLTGALRAREYEVAPFEGPRARGPGRSSFGPSSSCPYSPECVE